MTNGFRATAFRYHDQKGLVKVVRDGATLKNLNHLFYRFTDNGLGVLIKAYVEAIGSWGFERLDGPQGISNLLEGDGEAKGFQGFL